MANFVSKTGQLIIISAPSGAGKTSLAHALIGKHGDIVFSVSHTTRPQRPSEVDGKDYFFVDGCEFDKMVQEGKFLEYAKVFGHFYGTAKSVVDALAGKGLTVILDIDWQGAQQVRQSSPQVKSIFIIPPTIQCLELRLKRRGQDSVNVIQQRMQQALEQIAHHREFDHVICNDEFDRALYQLEDVIFANGNRVESAVDVAEKMLSVGIRV